MNVAWKIRNVMGIRNQVGKNKTEIWFRRVLGTSKGRPPNLRLVTCFNGMLQTCTRLGVLGI